MPWPGPCQRFPAWRRRCSASSLSRPVPLCSVTEARLAQVGDALRAFGVFIPRCRRGAAACPAGRGPETGAPAGRAGTSGCKRAARRPGRTRESLLLAADSCGAKSGELSGAGGAVAEPPHLLPDGVPAGRGRSPAAGGALSEIHPLCPGRGALPRGGPAC